MITEQERIIRESQGYDLGFEYNGKKYWLNTNDWSEDKEERFRQETGLCTFREIRGNKNLVIYDPGYFEVVEKRLHYKGIQEENIPQPINMSSCYEMFHNCEELISLDLSDWDVSKVVDTVAMFFGCAKLDALNLGDWKVSDGRFPAFMFFGCKNLISKYGSDDGYELLNRIITDSNNNLPSMNLFQEV